MYNIDFPDYIRVFVPIAWTPTCMTDDIAGEFHDFRLKWLAGPRPLSGFVNIPTSLIPRGEGPGYFTPAYLCPKCRNAVLVSSDLSRGLSRFLRRHIEGPTCQ